MELDSRRRSSKNNKPERPYCKYLYMNRYQVGLGLRGTLSSAQRTS